MGQVAQEDDELFNWLVNASGQGTGYPGGDFLRNLAKAALQADDENYPILRPVLVEMAEKYPKYEMAEKYPKYGEL